MGLRLRLFRLTQKTRQRSGGDHNMKKYVELIFNFHTKRENMPGIQIGQVFKHQRYEWITGQVIGVIYLADQPHYEIRIKSPGMASKNLTLNEEGVRAKFLVEKKSRLPGFERKYLAV
jgi:hypothetical protein